MTTKHRLKVIRVYRKAAYIMYLGTWIGVALMGAMLSICLYQGN